MFETYIIFLFQLISLYPFLLNDFFPDVMFCLYKYFIDHPLVFLSNQIKFMKSNFISFCVSNFAIIIYMLLIKIT